MPDVYVDIFFREGSACKYELYFCSIWYVMRLFRFDRTVILQVIVVNRDYGPPNASRQHFCLDAPVELATVAVSKVVQSAPLHLISQFFSRNTSYIRFHGSLPEETHAN